MQTNRDIRAETTTVNHPVKYPSDGQSRQPFADLLPTLNNPAPAPAPAPARAVAAAPITARSTGAKPATPTVAPAVVAAAKPPALFVLPKMAEAPAAAPAPAIAPTPAEPVPAHMNPFKKFHSLGYKRLVSIAQPGSQVSEHSSLFTRQDELGKIPGVLGANGWRGYDWLKFEPSEEHYDAWAAAGAGVGIRTGAGLVAMDIDTLDDQLGDICGRTATDILGKSPNRVGLAPKRLKLYRIAEDVPYQRLKFEGGAVELLSEGKQFVAQGIHPGTGKPYEWPQDIPRYDDLPLITPDGLAAFFTALATALPAAKHETSALPTAHAMDAAQLAGKADDVARAVKALPNGDQFATYGDYIAVAQAVKGALPDDEQLGLELFQEWASRWTGGDNDPDHVEADWHRCGPSRSLGAQYLYDLATKHSGGAFTIADVWFKTVPAGQHASALPSTERPAVQTSLDLRIIRGLSNPKNIKLREWIVEPQIAVGCVTLCVGREGTSKSTLAVRTALALVTRREDILRGRDASGGPIGPERIHRVGNVLVLDMEDSTDDMEGRKRAAELHYGVTDSEIRHDIILLSGTQDRDGQLKFVARSDPRGLLKPGPAVDLVTQLVREHDIKTVIAGPLIALSEGADENSNPDMRAVMRVFADLAKSLRIGVLLIHHSGKGADKAGTKDAARGASDIMAAARIAFTVADATGERDDEKALGIREEECLARVDYVKGNHVAPGRRTVFLKRVSVRIGNGVGRVPKGAGEILFDDPRAQQEALGDEAPVLEIVDVKARAAAAKAGADSRRQAEAKEIAAFVDAIMGAENRVKLAEVREALGAKMNAARIGKGTSRNAINERIKGALLDGCEIEHDGQSVVIAVERAGKNDKAAWYVVRKSAIRPIYNQSRADE